MAMVSVADPLSSVAPPASEFVITETSIHSRYFLCRSFVWLRRPSLCSHDMKRCTDVKQVLLCTHHLVRAPGKAAPHTTRAMR
jgi:hypothetical protein